MRGGAGGADGLLRAAGRGGGASPQRGRHQEPAGRRGVRPGAGISCWPTRRRTRASDLEELARRGVRVYVAFPKRVADGIAHLARLARIFRVGEDAGARELLAPWVPRAARSRGGPLAGRAGARVLPIWMQPLMTIHGDTFISDMLDLCGAQNVFADRPAALPAGRRSWARRNRCRPRRSATATSRYPRVTMGRGGGPRARAGAPPRRAAPLRDEDAAVFRALDIPAAKTGAVVRTGGKDLCWPGARSVEGIARVRELVRKYAGRR